MPDLPQARPCAHVRRLRSECWRRGSSDPARRLTARCTRTARRATARTRSSRSRRTTPASRPIAARRAISPAAAGATPEASGTPQAGATPAAGGAAPAIPHAIDGATYQDCTTCHGADKIKPFPANHASFATDSCTDVPQAGGRVRSDAGGQRHAASRRNVGGQRRSAGDPARHRGRLRTRTAPSATARTRSNRSRRTTPASQSIAARLAISQPLPRQKLLPCRRLLSRSKQLRRTVTIGVIG